MSLTIRLAIMELVKKMLSGDRVALAKLMTILERNPDEIPLIMEQIHPKTGSAVLIGITGPPGAGKSTLIDCLIKSIRKNKETVGVIAVDPSSTYTGGALLGDRIRMNQHVGDKDVFIRSLSTKGIFGGLSKVTKATTRLLDSYGFNKILLESVGVGQTELDIANVVDIVVVVLVPEAGDSIQLLKAGLIEIGDIFVVNKSDREGSDFLLDALKSELHETSNVRSWVPKVIKVSARDDVGVDGLLDEIQKLINKLSDSGELDLIRKLKLKHELKEAIRNSLDQMMSLDGILEVTGSIGESVMNGSIDPYNGAKKLLSSGELAKSINRRFNDVL